MSAHFNRQLFVCFFFSFLYFNGFHSSPSYYYYCYYYFTLVCFDWLPLNVFQYDGCPCLCCLNLFYLSLRWGGGSWLCCGYCCPWGWFHRAGVGLLANGRVVLGIWLILAMNVVNFLNNDTVWLTHCRTKIMQIYEVLPCDFTFGKLHHKAGDLE